MQAMLSSASDSEACVAGNSGAIVLGMDTNQSPIERACSKVGGQARLAEILNVTPAAVHQWVRGLRQVPTERCSSIERATEGAVTCEDLRPDLSDHWSYLRGTASAERRADEAAA